MALEGFKREVFARVLCQWCQLITLVILSLILLSDGDPTLVSKCDWACGLWQQLEQLLNLNLIYKILLTGTGIHLVISMLEKLNSFHLTIRMTFGSIDVKIGGSVLRCWNCFPYLSGARTLSLLSKRPSRKLEPWFGLWVFLRLRLSFFSKIGYSNQQFFMK